MLQIPHTSLRSLFKNRRAGHSLDAPFYVSPDVLAADMDVIFGHHWIYVGVEPDVPEPGDAMVVDIGPTSIFVVRTFYMWWLSRSPPPLSPPRSGFPPVLSWAGL